jgi:hypothetical protein
LYEYLVATFPSVSHALRFEKTMASLQKPVKLIPVPRVISSSCGIAARLPREMASALAEVAESGAAELENVYVFGGEGGKTTYIRNLPGPWGEPE